MLAPLTHRLLSSADFTSLDSAVLLMLPHNRGQTPLFFAAYAKDNALGSCQLLLQAGAVTDMADATGRVPHEYAKSNDVRMLLGGPDPR